MFNDWDLEDVSDIPLWDIKDIKYQVAEYNRQNSIYEKEMNALLHRVNGLRKLMKDNIHKIEVLAKMKVQVEAREEAQAQEREEAQKKRDVERSDLR